MAKLKPNLPRPFHSLREVEKKIIEKAYEDAMDKEICDTQVIWIKMASFILYDICQATDLDHTDPLEMVMLFLGSWKRVYTYNSRLPDKAAQEAWIGGKIAEIFGEKGFPEAFIQSLRNIGR